MKLPANLHLPAIVPHFGSKRLGMPEGGLEVSVPSPADPSHAVLLEPNSNRRTNIFKPAGLGFRVSARAISVVL